jgi:hypothetical protein
VTIVAWSSIEMFHWALSAAHWKDAYSSSLIQLAV